MNKLVMSIICILGCRGRLPFNDGEVTMTIYSIDRRYSYEFSLQQPALILSVIRHANSRYVRVPGTMPGGGTVVVVLLLVPACTLVLVRVQVVE